MIYHLEKFAYLTVSGLWTIPKITFANLCRPIHDGIIILVSPGPLNLKFVQRKGKNRKIWIFWVWKELFTEHKKIFFITLKCFLLVKYKKWQTQDLNKEGSWSSFSVLDRALFQSEGSLIDIFYFDLWLSYLGNVKFLFEKCVRYLLGRMDKFICNSTWCITKSFHTMHEHRAFSMFTIQYLYGWHEWLRTHEFVFTAYKTNCKSMF